MNKLHTLYMRQPPLLIMSMFKKTICKIIIFEKLAWICGNVLRSSLTMLCSSPFVAGWLSLFKEGLMGKQKKNLIKTLLGSHVVALCQCVFSFLIWLKGKGFCALNESDYHPLTKHHVRGFQLLLLISRFCA